MDTNVTSYVQLLQKQTHLFQKVYGVGFWVVWQECWFYGFAKGISSGQVYSFKFQVWSLKFLVLCFQFTVFGHKKKALIIAIRLVEKQSFTVYRNV